MELLALKSCRVSMSKSILKVLRSCNLSRLLTSFKTLYKVNSKNTTRAYRMQMLIKSWMRVFKLMSSASMTNSEIQRMSWICQGRCQEPTLKIHRKLLSLPASYCNSKAHPTLSKLIWSRSSKSLRSKSTWSPIWRCKSTVCNLKPSTRQNKPRNLLLKSLKKTQRLITWGDKWPNLFKTMQNCKT